jgi:hypothetical protein
VKAQETQLAAVQANTALLRPIKGVSYRKLEVPRDGQAATAVAFMNQFLEKNELVLWVNALTESLAWGEENSGTFESAMRDLGLFLGYGSQQPEKESGRGPDNLWAVGALKYFVIECKSGATQAQAINKHDCNQLNGSMTWFSAQYDQTCSATPIMVHPKTKPEFAATLHAASRIIEGDRLVKLIKALNDYAVAIGQNNGFAEPKVVAAQLQHFGLTPAEVIARYTVKPSK